MLKSLLRLLICALATTVSLYAQTSTDPPSLKGVYWFDSNTDYHSFTPGSFDVSTVGLDDGFHTFNAYISNGIETSSTHSKWFFKTARKLHENEKLTCQMYIDGLPYRTETTTVGKNGIVSINLDLNDVDLGMHMLGMNMSDANGCSIGFRTSVFMRVPTDLQYNTFKAFCYLDNDFVGVKETQFNNSIIHLDIDASALESGLHSITTHLVSPYGMASDSHTSWFIRIPNGGEGVKQYTYWLNDNVETQKTVVLDEVTNPCKLMALISVPEQPFRSKSFTFAIENNAPVYYTSNEFKIQFVDPDRRVSTASSRYTDTRTKYIPEVAINLGSDEHFNTGVISANSIKLYKFDAEIGDSLNIKVDKAAMIEVYSPTSETIISASGVDVTKNLTLTIRENGTHYMTIHDISGENSANLDFEHIPRFAILETSPERAGASDFIFMNVKGNGFDKLKSAKLKNADDEYPVDILNITSRYDLTLWADIDSLGVKHGVYDLELAFEDDGKTESVIKPAAIEIIPCQEAKIRTELILPRIAQTPYEIYVDVINDSDQQCWAIPVNIAAANSKRGISLEFLNFFAMETDTISSEVPEYFMTDDLLSTGASGVVIPLVIPYLGPKETIRLRLGVHSDPHDEFAMYAWNGEPWSEEFKKILAPGFNFEEISELDETNLLSARELVYLRALEDEEDAGKVHEQTTGMYHKKVVKTISIESAFNASWPCYNSAKYVVRNEAFRPYAGYTITGTGTTLVNSTLIRLGFNPVGKVTVLNINNFFRQFPTINKLKIKVVRKPSSGSSSSGAKSTNPNPKPTGKLVNVLQANDPNDLTGYIAPSGGQYMSRDIKSIDYTIEFENDPEMANASASEINVENILGKQYFDLSSFVPKLMRIGNKEMELPASHNFIVTMDMRPEINAIAELSFKYNTTSGKAQWQLKSLDPITLLPTVYANDGILPVNDDLNSGTGYLTYSINLLPNLENGTTVENKATIIFNDNEPIATPTWINITDYTQPTSKILSQTLSDDNCTVYFTVEGNDTGSGIWCYDLYMRGFNDTSWILVKPHIEEDSFSFSASESLADKMFAILATDRANNQQDDIIISGIPGDADGNGKVDVNDVVVTYNYYTGKSSNINLVNAEVTHDGVVDAQDATYMINMYVDKTKIITRKCK